MQGGEKGQNLRENIQNNAKRKPPSTLDDSSQGKYSCFLKIWCLEASPGKYLAMAVGMEGVLAAP